MDFEADQPEDDIDDQFEDLDEDIDEDDEEARPAEDDEPEDELTVEFVTRLVDRIMMFMALLVGHDLHSYQKPFARRIIRSIVTNDGAELTALAARQSGKSEIIADVIAALMVILPRLAKMYPDLLGQFKDGLLVGMFAPVEGQVETLYGRTVSRLTSDHAKNVLEDPEIDDITAKNPGVTKGLRLVKSGSTLLMMTANPRAKIESKSFQVIIIDECQETDDFMVAKSIMPMGAYYNATVVKTGTPTHTKNNFYKSIQLNKRLKADGHKQAHFQWDWKEVAKANPNYAKFIKKEMLRIGEDSDEFQLSYCCRWLLERGMFTTEAKLTALGDRSMQTVKSHHRSPVVVGIDPARKMDSTVVTVLWVDWDRPDEFGYYDHRVLNWLELQGDDWEEQYFQIVSFLENYEVLAVAVDGNGVGDAVAQRLKLLLPRSEVISLTSSQTEQSGRFKHLQALMQRDMISWPAHAKTRATRVYKRFIQQMEDAEVNYKGPNFVVSAPDEAHAHDDYVDSLAIAASLTKELVMPTMEVSTSPFYSR